MNFLFQAGSTRQSQRILIYVRGTMKISWNTIFLQSNLKSFAQSICTWILRGQPSKHAVLWRVEREKRYSTTSHESFTYIIQKFKWSFWSCYFATTSTGWRDGEYTIPYRYWLCSRKAFSKNRDFWPQYSRPWHFSCIGSNFVQQIFETKHGPAKNKEGGHNFVPLCLLLQSYLCLFLTKKPDFGRMVLAKLSSWVNCEGDRIERETKKQ